MFQYKIDKPNRIDLPFGKIQKQNAGETLYGFIDNKQASDIEERFYRGLVNTKRTDQILFLYPIISPRSMPGMLEVDFLVSSGAYLYVFQVDGEIAHKGVSKQQDDARKDVIVNEFFKKYNAFPVKRIPGIFLNNQEQANQTVRELIR